MSKNMNINSKMIFCVLGLLVVVGLILNTFFITRISFVTRGMVYEIFLEKLYHNLDSTQMYITEYYGKLSLKDNTIVNSAGNSIEGNFSMVDAISEDKNIYATIFIKQGVEFKRISTSIRNHRDERIVGSLLEPGNPLNSAKTNLLLGEPYVGQSGINGEMYLTGYKPLLDENNDVFGAIFVGMPMASINQYIKHEIGKTITLLILFSLIILVFLYFLMYKIINSIHAPIGKTVNVLKDIVESDIDFRKRLKIESNDEMGEMAFYINKILDEIFSMLVLVKKNANHVQNKSIELSFVAQQLLKNSVKMNDQSLFVSSTTEEINSNTSIIIDLAENSNSSVANVATASENLSTLINNLAAVTEHANANVNSIVDFINKFENSIDDTGNNISTLVNDIHSMTSVIEKLNQTFDLVAQNSQFAHDKSEIVNHEAQAMENAMIALLDLTNNFGKTAKTINNLSDKTNILVFNMSLEAARMGDAGRCFLAVIGEMKSLAKETADIMDSLAASIEKIQDMANNSNSFVKNITNNLSEMNSAIISSINEQNFTIDEIVQSQGGLSLFANNVEVKIANLVEYAKNIIAYANQTVVVYNDISQNIYNSAKTSNEITSCSANASGDVQEISKITLETMNRVKELSKNISLFQYEIHNTSLNAETSRKTSEELNHLAESLKKQTEKFTM